MIDIQTERLNLRLVPLTGLAATAAKDRRAARRIIGEKLPEVWFDEAWVSELRLKQWTADPAYGPWSIRAIGFKTTGEIIGNMNCHHVPMPFVLHGETAIAVEMGYTIFEPWRRRGFALEAIRGFTKWAATQGLEAIVLSVSPENTASLGLTAKLGATKIGSKIDEINGPEDIYFARI
ncbi:MAG: GNAT family N-acetyltransferase [Rhizobiales bacterium]|nr:GNAT family N-acetyltransferase [Hyphomicrobiales bacterium]